MKKLLAIVAAHLRRFAGDSFGNDIESPSTFSTLQGAGEDKFVSGAKKLSSILTVSATASKRESSSIAPQVGGARNELESSDGVRPRISLEIANSPSRPDFITREELKRELNLLRHLIESRK
jgi:hypothetical protein